MATEKRLIEYFVVKNKNTGHYFRGKGANRWGQYHNQASIYRMKKHAENTANWLKLRGEPVEIIPIKIIENPTVDAVEVVHGRWENVKETEVYSPDHRCTFTHTAETCSVCKIRAGFIGAKFYLYDDHCPNCGADMRDGDGNG